MQGSLYFFKPREVFLERHAGSHRAVSPPCDDDMCCIVRATRPHLTGCAECLGVILRPRRPRVQCDMPTAPWPRRMIAMHDRRGRTVDPLVLADICKRSGPAGSFSPLTCPGPRRLHAHPQPPYAYGLIGGAARHHRARPHPAPRGRRLLRRRQCRYRSRTGRRAPISTRAAAGARSSQYAACHPVLPPSASTSACVRPMRSALAAARGPAPPPPVTPTAPVSNATVCRARVVPRLMSDALQRLAQGCSAPLQRGMVMHPQIPPIVPPRAQQRRLHPPGGMRLRQRPS